MKPLIATLLLILLSACAPARYRVCWVGPYTGDTYCGHPMTRGAAKASAKQGSAEFPNIPHKAQRVTKGAR